MTMHDPSLRGLAVVLCRPQPWDAVAHAHAHVVPMHERTDTTPRRYVAEQHLTFRPSPGLVTAKLCVMTI